MRFKTVLAFVAALIALQACDRPATVELSYDFTPGRTLEYLLTAQARAQWNIVRPGRGSYEVTFRVVETVESMTEDGAILSVVMTPIDVNESGFPSPGSEKRRFSLQLNRDGEVVEVLTVQGVPARELDTDQIAFLGTYRPPLPDSQTGLYGEWKDDQDLSSGSVEQRTETLGRLEELGRDAGGSLAELSYSGRGPLLVTTTLPEGQAELSGTSVSSIDALLDIEGGFLRKASSSTRGDFLVSALPRQGGRPITGTLDLELDLELELQDT